MLDVPIDAAIRDVPWFWPGIAVSVALAVILSGPASRLLGVARLLGLLTVLSLAVVLVVTLTPSLDGGYWSSARYCGFQADAPLSPLALFRPEQRSLNVALLIPLGVCLSWVSNRKSTPWILLGGFLLPVAVEFTQFMLPVLGRNCELMDAIDNITGLVYGAAIGLLLRLL